MHMEVALPGNAFIFLPCSLFGLCCKSVKHLVWSDLGVCSISRDSRSCQPRPRRRAQARPPSGRPGARRAPTYLQVTLLFSPTLYFSSSPVTVPVLSPRVFSSCSLRVFPVCFLYILFTSCSLVYAFFTPSASTSFRLFLTRSPSVPPVTLSSAC